MRHGGGGQARNVGVCRMGVSVTGAMVVSHRLQCQGHLDVICLCCHIHCKPIALPLGISLLLHMVTTAAYTNLPKPELVQPVRAVSAVFSPVCCW